MSREPDVISISRALSNRRSQEESNAEPIGSITVDEFKVLVSQVVGDAVCTKMTHLENSVNRLADQFESIRNGESIDAALKVTTNLEAPVDLALARVTLSQEQNYPYTCSTLAEALNTSIYNTSKMIRDLGLCEQSKYHLLIKTGKKSEVKKYSEEALQYLKQQLIIQKNHAPKENIP